MAAPLQRSPIELELRRVLKSDDGIRAADYLDLPLLKNALTTAGAWNPASTENFSKALSAHLQTLIATLDEPSPDPAKSFRSALLIDFGIETAEAGVISTSKGRLAAAAAAAGLTVNAYYHDRAGDTKARTLALRQLIARMDPARDQPAVSDTAATDMRSAHRDAFNRAWDLLDRCRTNGSERPQSLEELKLLADQLAYDTGSDEARALVEFARYESSRGLETYRLIQGVTLLEAALDRYGSSDPELQLRLRLMVMREWMNLSLTGDLVPGHRRAFLERLIALADESLASPPPEVLSEQQLRLAAAEALKEMAFITHDATAQRCHYVRAQGECEKVLQTLEGRSDATALRLIAQAKRHEAITYELLADKEPDEERRKKYIEAWNRLSEEAAEDAGQVGDDFIQGYSLLNAASSQSRLTKFYGTASSKRDALRLGQEQLSEALQLLEGVDDERGQGWVHIHTCENTEQRAYLEASGSTERVQLLRELESHANHALSRLKHLEDSLGLTLAYLQLGKALFMLHEETGEDSATHVRLERATTVLSVALEMTKDIGYYQEAMTTSRWLARCLHTDWKMTDRTNSDQLVTAIEAQITGLCECYAGQGATSELEKLYRDLGRRLEGELQKHR